MMNVEKIKSDFPILSRKVNGRGLVYLDSAATSQKPMQVIGAISDYYENHNANVHRGVHKLSEEATEAYEGSRKKIAAFVSAKPDEMIFTRNATEGINLVAQCLGFVKISLLYPYPVFMANSIINFFTSIQKIPQIFLSSRVTNYQCFFRSLHSDKSKVISKVKYDKIIFQPKNSH